MNSWLKVRGKKRKTKPKQRGRERLVKASVEVSGRKQKSPRNQKVTSLKIHFKKKTSTRKRGGEGRQITRMINERKKMIANAR